MIGALILYVCAACAFNLYFGIRVLISKRGEKFVDSGKAFLYLMMTGYMLAVALLLLYWKGII